MSSFFEIPLALSLLAAGVPGTAFAVLIEGPAINLASLLVIARQSHWKVAILVAAAVWVTAVAGGLLLGLAFLLRFKVERVTHGNSPTSCDR